MRRAALILVLTAACASGDPKQNTLSISVFEQGAQRITAAGPHSFTVSVMNVSPAPIEIESIQLAPAGASDYTFEDAIQTVGDVISPGETREFPMFVTIASQGRSLSQFTSNLNSVNVTLSCRSETGSFVDSQVVSIAHR
jgi:hypothetical protein